MSNSFAQNVDWEWAKTFDGGGYDVGRKIATDAGGNVLVLGNFRADEMVVGNDTLHGSDFYTTIFIVKYDDGGNVLWAKSIDSNGDGLNSVDLVTDDNGDVLVTGVTETDTVFLGAVVLFNPGETNSFIASYDPSGNLNWATISSSSTFTDVHAMTMDNAHNIYLTGTYKDTLTWGGSTLINSDTATHKDDIFLVKLSPAGQVEWAKSYGTANSEDARGICADKLNHIYLSGSKGNSTIYFGNYPLAGYSFYVVQLDTSGNGIWSETYMYAGSEPEAIAADSTGNLYVTITFNDHAVIGQDTLFATGSDIFTVAYDVNGQMLWLKQTGAGAAEASSSITADGFGNAFIAGTFSSPTLTFGNSVLNSLHHADIMVGKFDASGTKLWARSAMGFGVIYCSDIATDRTGNIYVTGDFDSAYIVFGNDTLYNNNIYSNSFFIARLSYTTGISIQENRPGKIIYPNPSDGDFAILNPGNEKAEVVIYDATGQIQYSGTLAQPENNFNTSLPAGIYLVQIISGQKSFVQKLIIE